MADRLTPQDFVRIWREASVKESSGAKEHFIDLCRMLGEPTPVEADPAGSRYAFEMGAEKLDGRNGFADVCKIGYFAWEYKGPGGNLTTAYAQLIKYAHSLENPPLLVVSDMSDIIIHTDQEMSAKMR